MKLVLFLAISPGLYAQTGQNASLSRLFVQLSFPGARVEKMSAVESRKQFRETKGSEYYVVTGRPHEEELSFSTNSSRRLVETKTIALPNETYAVAMHYAFTGGPPCPRCGTMLKVGFAYKAGGGWKVDAQWLEDGVDPSVDSMRWENLRGEGQGNLLVRTTTADTDGLTGSLFLFDLRSNGMALAAKHRVLVDHSGKKEWFQEKSEKTLDVKRTRATKGRKLVFAVTTYANEDEVLPKPTVTEESIPFPHAVHSGTHSPLNGRFVRLSFPGTRVERASSLVGQDYFVFWGLPFIPNAEYFVVTGKSTDVGSSESSDVGTGRLSERRLVQVRSIPLAGTNKYAVSMNYTFPDVAHCIQCWSLSKLALAYGDGANWKMDTKLLDDAINPSIESMRFFDLRGNGVPNLLVYTAGGSEHGYTEGSLSVFDITDNEIILAARRQTKLDTMSDAWTGCCEKYEKKLDVEKTRATRGRSLVFGVTTYARENKLLPKPVITEERVAFQPPTPGQ